MNDMSDTVIIIEKISEKEVIVKCARCKGSGVYIHPDPCRVCNGKGVVLIKCERLPLVKCQRCSGSGVYIHPNPCKVCKGSGVQPIAGNWEIVN